ncbi:MAG: helix-turn-helix domain-containing protein [Pseudomonadota bacterium]
MLDENQLFNSNPFMIQVDIVLTDNFPALSLTLVTEPLRVANRESLDQRFHWRLLSVAGGKIRSSSGLEIETAPLDAARVEVVVLLSSYQPEAAIEARLINWLKRRAHTNAVMGCVDTAALIFAAAGLLRGHRAAVHFEAIEGYRESFPEAAFVDRLFDLSERRCSSAGGVATIDMTLALIARFVDPQLAARVAEILTYRPLGEAGDARNIAARTALMRVDRDMARAVDLMIATIDAPVPLAGIAAQIDVPVWKLDRLFRRHLQQSPGRYYLSLRLDRARDLLRNSHISVARIGSMCGFENPETFSRAYRRRFGVTAKGERLPSNGKADTV